MHLYTPMLLHWTRQAGLSEADAQDVMQDVFARLLVALPGFTYDPTRSFLGYLNTVLSNCWVDLRRKRWSQMRASTGLTDAEFAEPPPEIQETDYRQALLRRSLSLVEHEFSPKIWRGFVLTVLEGKTPKEAALILNATVNAIYLGRARVLRRLREVLQDFLE